MDMYVTGMDMSVTRKGPTQDHEDALDGVEEDLRQEVVHHALILGEAVEDAAGGVGVEEAERRAQDVARHLLVHQCRSAASHDWGSVVTLGSSADPVEACCATAPRIHAAGEAWMMPCICLVMAVVALHQ